MPLDRFAARFSKYELRHLQMSLELAISLSLMKNCEGMCLVLSPFMIEFM